MITHFLFQKRSAREVARVENRLLYAPVLRCLRKSKYATLLEVGLAPLLHQYYPSLGMTSALIEPTEEMIETQTQGNTTVVQPTHLPFGEKTFDAVVSVDALVHLTTMQARQEMVYELLRVAGKVLILGFPNGTNSQSLERYLMSRDAFMGLSHIRRSDYMDHVLPDVSVVKDWVLSASRTLKCTADIQVLYYDSKWWKRVRTGLLSSVFFRWLPFSKARLALFYPLSAMLAKFGRGYQVYLIIHKNA